MKKIIYSLTGFILLLAVNLSGQGIDTIKTDSTSLNQGAPGIVMDTIGNSDIYVPTKDPMTAVWKSAILPGWGQYYNESYWKIPVFWGVFGWLAYNYVTNNNNYSDYKSLYIQSGFSIESYRRLRDFYRDQRDLFVIYIGIAYLANLLDAYVDASLFDFDVSENFNTGSKQLNFKFKF
ncbi:MAG: hypothetical protein J0L60_08690 [Ignavibacteria bacterium]|nr:hypothetical protein [Ignavibacteria bacterium]